MSSRRSRFEISVDVLTAISHGEHKPTRLMYACNLSWNSIKNTLTFLVARGFVDEMSEKQKRKRYCITAKGRDVIGYCTGLQDLVKVSVN
jgi:predicted transcriptional regulator